MIKEPRLRFTREEQTDPALEKPIRRAAGQKPRAPPLHNPAAGAGGEAAPDFRKAEQAGFPVPVQFCRHALRSTALAYRVRHPTGITQNIKDLLASREIENIFENSDFVYMLNQASGDVNRFVFI